MATVDLKINLLRIPASRQIKMFNNHKITSIEEVALVEGDAATNTDAKLEPSNVRFAEWLSQRVR